MKLAEMKVTEYLEVLKSDAPAPGGGSVSALAGAQGIALFMMVCDLTLGKAKYEEYQEVCRETKERGKSLYQSLLCAVDQDTEAFHMVSAAYKMPKETQTEKEARSKAISAGTLEATKVPFHVMELAYKGLFLAVGLAGRSNSNAASDLGVAALNLLACIKGAWLNVKINISGVKDENFAKQFLEEGERMVMEAEKIEKVVYQKMLLEMEG